jgi:uncharacterized protein YehS (DUF1456 family)
MTNRSIDQAARQHKPMDNNQLVQLLQEALELTENELVEIGQLSGWEPLSATIPLPYFLEGLILRERGPRPGGGPVVVDDTSLSNNQVLKKLRIALNLQEVDVQLIFEEGDVSLSASELGALFRKEGNKHFRPCSDVLLQSFVAGLTPSLDA